jgi:hypothetical protein
MPTRLRRLTRKAIMDVLFCLFVVVSSNSDSCHAIGDVGLPQKLGGRLPRGMPISHAIS